jgi:predicted nucleotidyltransferase
VAKIAVRHGASNVRLIGSVARGEEGPESDVDLMIAATRSSAAITTTTDVP